jgi:hypothetical protein
MSQLNEICEEIGSHEKRGFAFSFLSRLAPIPIEIGRTYDVVADILQFKESTQTTQRAGFLDLFHATQLIVTVDGSSRGENDSQGKPRSSGEYDIERSEREMPDDSTVFHDSLKPDGTSSSFFLTDLSSRRTSFGTDRSDLSRLRTDRSKMSRDSESDIAVVRQRRRSTGKPKRTSSQDDLVLHCIATYLPSLCSISSCSDIPCFIHACMCVHTPYSSQMYSFIWD